MKTLYQTKVKASGGRNGHVRSDDGILDMDLSMPRSLGGSKEATNPEQLFGAGYAACFENALLHVAKLKKQPVESSAVTAEVQLKTFDDGRFNIAVSLEVELGGLATEPAAKLIEEAHRVCPYSNATRGNIEFAIFYRGEKLAL